MTKEEMLEKCEFSMDEGIFKYIDCFDEIFDKLFNMTEEEETS